MEKIFLFLITFFLGTEILWGQGLENMFVEIITPTSTAISADPKLNSNTRTYRVFVDMETGYKVQTITGITLNPIKIKTSTTFYNNYDGGQYFPTGVAFRTHPALNEPLYYDSWLTIGSFGDLDRPTSAAQIVPLNLDTDGTRDGVMLSPKQSIPNLDPASNLGSYFDYEMGNSFESFNFVVYALEGVAGITSENMVCIGQFTTDGTFSFEMCIQVGNGIITKLYVTRKADEFQYHHIRSDKMFYPVNTPPSVSINSPADDSQFNINDNININATATDTEDPIYKVEFVVNGGGKVTHIDYDAPFSYEWKATTEGTKEILAIAQDSRGSRDTAIISVFVNGPMQASLTSPAHGSEYNMGANVSFAATASDASGIKKIEFLVDGIVVGEDNSSPYEFNWSANLPGGSRKVKAKATNNNNGTKDSDEATITVKVLNNNDPVVSFTIPAHSDSIPIGKKITISAIASDTDPGDGISKVEFYYNSTKIGEDNSSPYEIDWTTSVLGLNQLKVIAYDTKGGSKTAPTIPVFVTSLPMVFFTKPQTSNQEFLQGDVIEMLVTVANNNPTKWVKVEFYVNMEKVGEALNAPYSFNWTSTSGDSIKAICTDYYGGKASAFTKIIINGQTPTISISSPANNAVVTEGNNVLITTNVTNPNANGSVTKVEFMINDTKVGEDNTDPYEYSWNSGQPGQKSIKAVVFDNNGKTSNSQDVTVFINAKPTINITSPSNNSKFSVGNNLNFTAEATDVDGNIASVEFYVNDAKFGSSLTTAPYSLSWTSTGGSKKITAIATDNHGAKTVSDTVRITDATSIRGLKAGQSLSIYPNPASDNIIIQLKSQWVNLDVVSFKIFDMGGKTLINDKLQMEELENGVKIDISSIPNGINTIQLFSDDGTINISMQFIKI